MHRLKEIAPFAGIVARERTRGTSGYDDAYQEGMIAAWQVLAERPDAPREYLIAAVKNGINSHVGRGRVTGSSQRGKKHIPTQGFPEGFDVMSDDPTESMDSDVRNALIRLPQHDREFVYLRFWLGMTGEEAAKIVGIPRGTLERRFVQFTKPHLREALSEDSIR